MRGEVSERGERGARERGERGESHLRALAHALCVLDRARGEFHEPGAQSWGGSQNSGVGVCSVDKKWGGCVAVGMTEEASAP